MFVYKYHWGWKFRYLILLSIGLPVFSLFGFFMNPEVDLFSVFQLFCIIILLNLLNWLKDSYSIANKVSIENNIINFHYRFKKTISFKLSTLEKYEYVSNPKDTSNSFGQPQLVLMFDGKKYLIMKAILKFEELKLIIEKQSTSHIILQTKSVKLIDKKTKNHRQIPFYLIALIIVSHLGYEHYKSLENEWLYGDVSTGIILEPSIPCNQPKIIVNEYLYKIVNCAKYPANTRLPVISILGADMQVFVGEKGNSPYEYLWERGKVKFILITLLFLILFSKLFSTTRKYFQTKL